MCTYIGGTKACIDALVGDQELEALRVTVDQKINCEQDTVNPVPADPPPWLTDSGPRQ